MSVTTDRPLAGRVAVVTGAGAGLGRAHALLLARLGAAVVVNDHGGSVRGEGHDAGPAQAVVEEIVAAGGQAVASDDSVALTGAGERIVGLALEEFGRVDVVVANAGILRDHEYSRLETPSWDAVLDVHLRGSYEVTRAAWAPMLEQGYGRIVLTTSAAGLFGNAGHANYGAAKAGTFGLMRMLAVEAGARDVLVNAVAPLALTRMSGSKDGDRSRASDMMGDLFNRLAPEHVSPLVAFLCQEQCRSQGRAFSVGGGRIAEIFVGETSGWVGDEPTWQAVRDHWSQICDRDGYTVPRSMRDEIDLYLRALT